MVFVIQKVLQSLILPPASILVLILTGLILLRWRRTAGRALLAAGILLLYGLSLDPVASRLIRPLEAAYTPFAGTGSRPDAVVVLGGGAKDLGWVPASPEPSGQSLERLVTGIRLVRTLHLPLVVAGGSGWIAAGGVAEADAMADVAEKLGIPRKDIVIENHSRNTWENAAAVKQAIPGRTVILVTSAYHMKRAAGMFRKQGFSVIPAPAAYKSASRPLSITALLPRAGALDTSSSALAEYLSLAWYWSFGKL